MRAQNVITKNMQEKHAQEMKQVNDFNSQEFEEFTLFWDKQLADLRMQISQQINGLQQTHYQQQD